MKEHTRISHNSRSARDEQLANGLGWFSIGLGLAEVVAPGQVAQLIGVKDRDNTRTLLRAYGLREISAGVGILSQTRPAGWLWARVAGDLLDLASLGSALASEDTDKARLTTATAAVVGVTVLDILCGQQLSRAPGNRARSNGSAAKNSGGQVTKTLIINRPPDEVYRFWRDIEKLPSFMDHLESVRVTGDRQSHWVAKGPGGKTFEWDAEIVNDEPGSHISWRALPDSGIHNAGTVRFERAPGGRGTLLRVQMHYAPPGGTISANVAKIFGAEPGQLLERDLRVLKQILETGERAKSDASIHAGMHAAQPPSSKETESSPDLVRQEASLSYA